MFWSKAQSLKLLFPALLVAGVLAMGLNGQAYAKSKRGWLGVGIRELTPSMKDEYRVGSRDGLLIVDVAPHSPAEDAGLREDDVILKFNGHPVARAREFSKMVRDVEPGTEVKLLVLRDGEEKEIKATVGRRRRHRVRFSSNRFSILVGRPRLGVEVHELNADLAAYFDVDEHGGALITDVFEDSPAEDAGLKAGDVIVKVDDEEISDPDDLMDTLEEYEEGDVVTVEFLRKGKKDKVEVELEEMNAYGFRFWNPERDGARFFLFDKFMSHGPRIRMRAPKVRAGSTLI